jgi:phosphate starvation-inducible protein PhoH
MARKKASAILGSLEDLEYHNSRNGETLSFNTKTSKTRSKDSIFIRNLKWTDKQKEFIKLALDKDTKIIFIEGPAGTSKTLLSVYCGLRLLSDNRAEDLTYVRSAVESSDARLGFLPGDAEDKLHYFNLPFLDKLHELVSDEEIKKLQKSQRVSTYPVNFSRGMSWNNKCVIFDECQNSSLKEIITVLTRIGEGTKMFLCADNRQTDLKNGNRGSFAKIMKTFSDEESKENNIHTFTFNHNDIMRSEILKFIIKKIDTQAV